jgi:hypothetical protein
MSEHEHTKTDGLGETPPVPLMPEAPGLRADWRAAPRNDKMAAHKIECNA